VPPTSPSLSVSLFFSLPFSLPFSLLLRQATLKPAPSHAKHSKLRAAVREQIKRDRAVIETIGKKAALEVSRHRVEMGRATTHV
jgi:hypothetical protein